MNAAISKPAPPVRSQHRRTTAFPQRTNKRAIWDLAIGFAGLVYLGIVLFDNLYSPLFGLVLIGLAAYEILEPHCSKRPNIASAAGGITAKTGQGRHGRDGIRLAANTGVDAGESARRVDIRASRA